LGGYHKKVSDEMTIGGVPPNKPIGFLPNPGLTLKTWDSTVTNMFFCSVLFGDFT